MKNVLIIVFCFFLANNIFPQTGSPKNDTINGIIDYYTFKLVSIPLDEVSLSNLEVKCNNSNKINISAIKDYFNNEKKTYDLITEIQSIKKNENFEHKDISELILFLSINIFESPKYKKIKAFRENNINKFNGINLKDILNEHYKEIYSNNTSEFNVETNPNISEDIHSNNNGNVSNDYNKKSDNQLLIYLILALTLINIILVFILFRKNANFNYSLEKNEKKMNEFFSTYRNNKYESNIIKPNYNLDLINKKINEIEYNVKLLRDRYFEIQRDLIKNEMPIKGTIDIPPYPQKMQSTFENLANNQSILIYFFSTPNNDGSFLDAYKSIDFDSSNLSMYFKFEIDTNKPNIAKVSIIEDTKTQNHIIKNYKDYLDSVSNYENICSPTNTRIITVKSGEAELIVNKWVINKKIQIKFE